MTDHRRTPSKLSDAVRMELMIQLRKRGWTYERIGRRVGMSTNGVMMALRRGTDPDSYYKKLDEEVDNPIPDEEEW